MGRENSMKLLPTNASTVMRMENTYNNKNRAYGLFPTNQYGCVPGLSLQTQPIYICLIGQKHREALRWAYLHLHGGDASGRHSYF